MPLEIGLIGATGIAERTLLQQGARIRAVAASDPVRAKEYANRHEIPVVHESYSALLADPAIDAVYISLHNSAHHRWAVRAAVAGKHVIVEKPLCLTADEVAELAFAAADVKIFEAVATADHPWQQLVHDFIQDENYGALLKATTQVRFAVPPPDGYRDRPELGGGIFFDAASYWLQAVQATIGLDPVTAEGRSDFDGPNEVDRSFEASLRWATGVEATLTADVGDQHISDHVFTFERATVKLRNFLRPVAGAVPLNLIVTPTDGDRRVIGFPAVAYYERQLARILDSTTDDLDAAAPRIALMDEIYSDALRRKES
ncbi:Gfo/Idh/MocA family oxidoreductase [Streptomyces sp. SID13031]|uniref:Gfo/Idh/MocA family protein n=1 Tax=Streptomyces sp. SID13031 TaxID=2706046 RepID=UPI0013C65EF0|nr:Gfo/Idh/MocA family oxidoreductase [Streptomyces sp. SID13031]NEA33881.1 Gfo/Idh/MocA family oxidoreductase [Streptomyces sp. SID13031]